MTRQKKKRKSFIQNQTRECFRFADLAKPKSILDVVSGAAQQTCGLDERLYFDFPPPRPFSSAQ